MKTRIWLSKKVQKQENTFIFPFIGTYLKNSIKYSTEKRQVDPHSAIKPPYTDVSSNKDWKRHQEVHSSEISKIFLKKESCSHHRRVKAQQLFGTNLKLQTQTLPQQREQTEPGTPMCVCSGTKGSWTQGGTAISRVILTII